MKREIINLPASIHERLNRLAKETNRSFQEVFTIIRWSDSCIVYPNPDIAVALS